MRTNLLRKMLVPATAVLVGGLTSCGSTGSRQVAAGQALINAAPGGKHEDRIKGVKLVAVNGQSASRGKSAIRSGTNNVKVRFDWPQGGSQEVSLKFNARQDQKYFVKYDPFPPTANQFRGTTEATNLARVFTGAAGEFMQIPHPAGAVIGLAVLAPSIPIGTLDYAHRIKETIREAHSPVKYVDLFVISEDGSEGVVRRVRAYPSGRLESEPYWDEYRYTPGIHLRGGLTEDYADLEVLSGEFRHVVPER